MEAQTLKYKDKLLVYFYAWITKPLEERRQTKTFTISITNKSTLLSANVALEEIISEHIKGGTLMSMEDMNTLQYVTALTLAGKKEKFDPSKV